MNGINSLGKPIKTRFPEEQEPAGDITQIAGSEIPDHDVLVAGLPCQPFSIAGVSKKNSLGRAHGFLDETQGTLFFDVCRILNEKRPAAFLIENVKNLRGHDKGRTFDVISRNLSAAENLGYELHVKIIDGDGFVPQHRERIFLVGFREPTAFSWDDILLPEKGSMRMEHVLHPQDGTERVETGRDSKKGVRAWEERSGKSSLHAQRQALGLSASI